MNINSSSGSLGFVNRMMGLAQQKQANQMAKLSSGYRINSGKDAPADLVISEQLRAQSYGTERALRNTMETNNVLSVADGALGSVADMLTKMKGLAVHAGNTGVTGGSQVSADQSEMNSLLNSIQRVAGTTNYAGTQLLNGSDSLGGSVSSDPGKMMVPGSFASERAAPGSAGNRLTVAFDGGPANQAEKAYLTGQEQTDGVLAERQEFTINGTKGGRAYAFDAGTSLEDVASAINQNRDATGVTAELVRDDAGNATQLRLTSQEYGSKQFVQVEQREGDLLAARGQTARDQGQDARVYVNGRLASADGLKVNYNDGQGNQGSFALSAEAAGQRGYDQANPVNAEAAQAGVSVSGGMQLQLGGGGTKADQDKIGLPNLNLSNLGKVTVDGKTYSMQDLYSGGAAALGTDPSLAMKIVDQAISDVSNSRGQIGAYQANTLQSNMNNLEVELQNVTSTESGIRDTDMAKSITDMLMDRLREQVGIKVYQSAKMSTQNTARLLLGQGQN